MSNFQNTTIQITSPDIRNIEKRLGSLSGKAPNVMSNVLKRVISRVKQIAPKEISKKYKITTANFKTWIKYSKVSTSNLNASYSAKSYPLSISKYYKSKPNKPKSTKGKTLKQIKKMSGVKTMVETGHGFTTHKHAFIQKMKNGHYGVFERIKSTKKIEEIKGPAAGSILGNEDITQKIQIEADKVINTRLEHEISRLLGR